MSAKFLTILFLSLSVLFFTGCRVNQEVITQDSASTDLIQELGLEESSLVNLSVINNLGEELSFSSGFSDGDTAYSFLQRLDEENENLTIEYNSFDFNGTPSYFITTINGYNPEVDNSYWSLYVNGEMSSVGISEYSLQPGDTISLEVESI